VIGLVATLDRRRQAEQGRPPARLRLGRQPSAWPGRPKAYVKAHKNVQVKIVTYDGDGNGATTMQTKIQLWNRTGQGLADCRLHRAARTTPFGWRQPPFDFAT
jgi:hypothetical protein